MTQPTLFLFVGYPGAGKTTVARLIAERTGAVHLWADNERMKRFGKPTHSHAESHALYTALNEQAEALLRAGHSVVFDTNFNYYNDREHLRHIAEQASARCVLIWLITPIALAKQRAVHDANLRNGYEVLMTEEHFDELAAKLEAPKPEEQAIEIDSTQLISDDVFARITV